MALLRRAALEVQKKRRYHVAVKNILIALLLGVFLLSTPVYAGKEKKTIENAVLVLDEIMAIPEKGIPPALLTDAHAIAIIPGTIKVGSRRPLPPAGELRLEQSLLHQLFGGKYRLADRRPVD